MSDTTEPQTTLEHKTASELLAFAVERGGTLGLGPNADLVLQRSQKGGEWQPDPALPPRVRVQGRAWVDKRPVQTDVEVDLADMVAAISAARANYGRAWDELLDRALDLRAAELRRLADSYRRQG